jgi:hypothetical protein
MKNYFKLCLVACLLFSIYSCKEKEDEYAEKTENEEQGMTQEALVKRGEYLVNIIGCDHCHTPKIFTENGPVPDMDRRLMGFPATDSIAEINKDVLGPGKWMMMNGELTAFVGPWGVSFGANITSDDTGIGTWSYDQFKKAMTEGKYKGMENGRPIMPPMPWESFQMLEENDLKSIYEFLQTTKPIENVVPAYIPPPAM